MLCSVHFVWSADVSSPHHARLCYHTRQHMLPADSHILPFPNAYCLQTHLPKLQNLFNDHHCLPSHSSGKTVKTAFVREKQKLKSFCGETKKKISVISKHAVRYWTSSVSSTQLPANLERPFSGRTGNKDR